TELWAWVRNETGFTRQIVDSPGMKYNRRLLYLLGVAACWRLEHLFSDPRYHRMLRVAEMYAEGKSTLDKLCEAQEKVDQIQTSDVVSQSLERAVFWLVGADDYKIIEGLDYASDNAGYRRAIATGALSANISLGISMAIWKHRDFRAGKAEEELALCHLLR